MCKRNAKKEKEYKGYPKSQEWETKPSIIIEESCQWADSKLPSVEARILIFFQHVSLQDQHYLNHTLIDSHELRSHCFFSPFLHHVQNQYLPYSNILQVQHLAKVITYMFCNSSKMHVLSILLTIGTIFIFIFYSFHCRCTLPLPRPLPENGMCYSL